MRGSLHRLVMPQETTMTTACMHMVTGMEMGMSM